MWALARFCAPWVPDGGEKGKSALSRERKAFGMFRRGHRAPGDEDARGIGGADAFFRGCSFLEFVTQGVDLAGEPLGVVVEGHLVDQERVEACERGCGSAFKSPCGP